MSISIYKYVLEITDDQVISIPGPLELLSIQLQGGRLCLWAKVCVEAPLEKVPIRIVGTGHSFDDCLDGWQFLSTVQQGIYVWHVFYKDPNR